MSNEPIDEEIQELTGKVLDALTPKQPQPAEQVTQTGPHPSESGGCILPASQSANEPEQWLTEELIEKNSKGMSSTELLDFCAEFEKRVRADERDKLIGIASSEPELASKHDCLLELAAMDKQLATARDHVDLMKDEFIRIRNLHQDDTAHDREVLGLCQRAITNTDQNVPVLLQRDKAVKQLASLQIADKAEVIAHQKTCEELVNLKAQYRQVADKIRTVLRHDLHLSIPAHSELCDMLQILTGEESK